MKKLVWLMFVFSCARLAHVEPQPRGFTAATLTSVEVVSHCAGKVGRHGHGVIISERHVITAQHVVRCAELPTVRVTFATKGGLKTLRMAVTREDPDADIARLEILSAERFQLNVAPPKLWPVDSLPTNEYACAWTPGSTIKYGKCGFVGVDPTMINLMVAEYGDSGAGVYTQGLDTTRGVWTGMEGYLIGIIIRDGGDFIRIAPIDVSWLEGT
jgi:hypothetical protein